MTQTLFLDPPADFSFKNTVDSHGWRELRPFEIDESNWQLTYVFAADKGGRPVSGTFKEEDGRVRIDLSGDKIAPERVLREVRHILRMDDDLSGFYKHIRKEKSLAWIAKIKAGRMLRSPTVFEDLVKTICTTNCSWSLTKKMVTNLVEKLGEQAKDGRRTFPTPEAMAGVTPDFYRNEIRAGYRSEYLAELAEKVASGQLDPEKWVISDQPTKDLKKEMKNVKGVGDYAAENLMKLVGRYDGLALDSWLRSQFYKKHNAEAVCEDKRIHEFYEKYGDWRGLAIWCEMTERWLDREG
jgi:3-methyladenine DNA glycosylase/8-oxoguanine DNA glycosylase